MARYGMVIDTKRCIGCNACTVKCRYSNNLPMGIYWNRVETVGGSNPDAPAGVYPNFSMYYTAISCQHCSNPACVAVCPVGATYKDEETGIVRQDSSICIGCKTCMQACPYNVRVLLEEEPKYAVDFALGEIDAPAHAAGTVEKCTMCWERVQKGKEPSCIENCTTRARYWGDFDDPESEVSKLIATREWEQLLPDRGTEPNVYYLI